MSTLPGHAVFDWGILKKRARPNDGCVEVRGQASSPFGDFRGVAMRFVPLQRFGEADCTTIDLFGDCPGHGVIEVTGKGKFSAKLMSGTSPSNWLSPRSIDGDCHRFDLPAGMIRLFDSSPLLSDSRGTTVELPVGGLLRLNAASWHEGTGIVNIEVHDDAGRPSDQFLLKVGRGRREETNFIGALYGSKVRIPAEPGDYSVVLLDSAATVIARRRLIVRPGEESSLVLP